MNSNIWVYLEQREKMRKIDFFIFTKSWTLNGPKWTKMDQNGPKMAKMMHKCAKFYSSVISQWVPHVPQGIYNYNTYIYIGRPGYWYTLHQIKAYTKSRASAHAKRGPRALRPSASVLARGPRFARAPALASRARCARSRVSKPLKTTQNHSKPLKITRKINKINKIIQNHSKSLKITQNHSKSLKIRQNISSISQNAPKYIKSTKSLKLTQNHSKSLKITQNTSK